MYKILQVGSLHSNGLKICLAMLGAAPWMTLRPGKRMRSTGACGSAGGSSARSGSAGSGGGQSCAAPPRWVGTRLTVLEVWPPCLQSHTAWCPCRAFSCLYGCLKLVKATLSETCSNLQLVPSLQLGCDEVCMEAC